MGQIYKVVAVSGSVQSPSRTLALIEQLVNTLGDAVPIEVQHLDVGALAPLIGSALSRTQLPAAAEASIQAIESADVLIVASPVYRGSYTGLFKHLFDFVHHEALIDVPVLLAATGGSERHSLVIDHQLRPLFSFFQARTLPIGVYATEQDFSNYEITSAPLLERIRLAIERAVPLLDRAPLLKAQAAPTPVAA
ncbi:MAG: FMN reductase [Giesbergeria sp.]|uniref:FMN reductase n=1 Tax=Giesbergeria sp. TaxID=2818473 RepID=UPI002614CDED|nr:FMN reductase [Giesbergeria sp.]MDD2609577.1 FMN reductase [Giesbergeria sp.]